MGTVFKKTFTKPIPADAEILVRRGERFARWKAKGKLRTAPLTAGLDGTGRLLVTAATYTAKYRDGSGIVREVATGCRDEAAARSVLTELERRAERVKSNLITGAEDAIADHLATPIAVHFAEYLTHLQAKGISAVHLADTERLANRVFADCSFARLGDVRPEPLEQWLVAKTGDGMAARTRNSYLQAVRGFCSWCVHTGRMLTNPLAKIDKADEKSDRRRQRRSLTEAELVRLIEAARLRPLAEFGRLAVQKDTAEVKGKRDTWKAAPLTFDDLDAATERARERLRNNPPQVERLEWLGRERALVYATLVLTGLRRGELASLTVGQFHLDGPQAYAELDAADEKNRQGATIAIRSDLAAELRQWIKDKRERLQRDAVRSDGQSCLPMTGVPDKLPADAPLFIVPRQLVKILDRDLKLASIPKRDDRGRTIDVHAMRHTFGSWLSKGGVSLRTAQAAMRHSDPSLTANVYTDPRLLDVHGAVESLPSLPFDKPHRSNTEAATGTDGRANLLAPTLAPSAFNSCTPKTIPVTSAGDPKANPNRATLDATSSAVSTKKPLTTAVSGFDKRGRRDSNPQPPDRQSGTLTN